jgi:hypothetical protein
MAAAPSRVPRAPLAATADLERLQRDARLAAPIVGAHQQLIEVPPSLAPLLPEGGLRRGTVVEIAAAPGATTLAVALTAQASQAGGWVVFIGGQVGLPAAVELGVRVERLAVVRAESDQWAACVAACVDAVELVVAWPPPHLAAADGRRLTARLRERGAVLLVVGATSLEATVRLRPLGPSWSGLERGHGRLAARQVTVEVSGRASASRSRQHRLLLPDHRGAAAPDSVAAVVPLRVETRQAG